MPTTNLVGRLVRLEVPQKPRDVDLELMLERDSRFLRLLDDGPAMVWPRREIERWFDDHGPDRNLWLTIVRMADDKPLGALTFSQVDPSAHSVWVGIGIGPEENWGKGYGTEAMQLAARFAFEQMNLHRINLNVFSFNPRALRSYEKVGFVHEGTIPEVLLRDGQRWDMHYMGLLRSDWERLTQKND